MTEVRVNGSKVVFYDSIKQLPIRRYQQSNKYLMIASDIGSDFQDFDRKTVKVIELLKKGMTADAVKELENRRQAVWNAYKNYNPRGMSLALLVHSINGRLRNDITDEGLEKTLDELNRIGFSYDNMETSLSDVKKNSKFSLKRTFRIILNRMKKHSTILTY